MIKKLFVIASAIFVLAVAGLMGWMYIMGDNKEFAKEGAQIVHVKVGMSTTDIAQMLHEKQLVKNPDAFKFEARFKGLAGTEKRNCPSSRKTDWSQITKRRKRYLWANKTIL